MSMAVTEQETQEYILGPLNRCDACSAEALVWVKGVSGELYFCGHHFKKHENKLKDFAYEIIDERSKLIEDKSKEPPHA